tara:strand:+ start:20 stop:451 length:432 start_codon:yes stop_codon:yes gene_type:complete
VIKKKIFSQADKKTWEDYIKNPSDIYDKEIDGVKNYNRKERLKFDLHGFTLDDANKRVKELISSCFENNYKEILLITGKGIHSSNDKDVYKSKNFGRLKYSVPEFIRSDTELSKIIVSIRIADIEDGGDGAILIKLKNLQNKL